MADDDTTLSNVRGGQLLQPLPALQHPGHDEHLRKYALPKDPGGDRRLVISLASAQQLLDMTERSVSQRAELSAVFVHIIQLRDPRGHSYQLWTVEGQLRPEPVLGMERGTATTWHSARLSAADRVYVTTNNGTVPRPGDTTERYLFTERADALNMVAIASSSPNRRLVMHGVQVEVSLYRRKNGEIYEVWALSGRPLPEGTSAERTVLDRR